VDSPRKVSTVPIKSKAAALLVLITAPLLAGVHLFYYWAGGLYLYWIAGGITQNGRWTRYGGAQFAWTIPLELPGTILLSSHKLSSLGDSVAKALILAASLVTGYSAASLAVSFILKRERPRPYRDWRIWALVLAIVWIPVPETLALVYYYTVKY
jgi:hypothetical protein